MLERKYGGVKARNAALTIQRAFRRYTLLKKFAAITAMAKAEKRMSRKFQDNEHQEQQQQHQQQQQQDRITYQSQIYIQQQQNQSPRPTPIRSMSLRERRYGAVVDGSQSPIPRTTQSGRCEIHISGHQVCYPVLLFFIKSLYLSLFFLL